MDGRRTEGLMAHLNCTPTIHLSPGATRQGSELRKAGCLSIVFLCASLFVNMIREMLRRGAQEVEDAEDQAAGDSQATLFGTKKEPTSNE